MLLQTEFGRGLRDDPSQQRAQTSTVFFSSFSKVKIRILSTDVSHSTYTFAQTQNAHRRICIDVGALRVKVKAVVKLIRHQV